MASKSRFFKANSSVMLLQSAALAVALLVQASPARAEVVTLICQNNYQSTKNNQGPSSFTLRINYNQKVVEFLKPDGTVWFSEAATTITESAVQWPSDRRQRVGTIFFTGELNRLSGEGSVNFAETGDSFFTSVEGPCRRATQKF